MMTEQQAQQQIQSTPSGEDASQVQLQRLANAEQVAMRQQQQQIAQQQMFQEQMMHQQQLQQQMQQQ